MSSRLTVGVIDAMKETARGIVTEAARRLAFLRHADVRLEVIEAKSAGAENGASKFSGEDAGGALGVRVLAGNRMVAAGYAGMPVGAADLPRFERVLRDALERAYQRAIVNGELKAEARE